MESLKKYSIENYFKDECVTLETATVGTNKFKYIRTNDTI